MAVFSKNGNWYIDYWFNGRRVKKMIGKNKALAESVLRKIQTDIVEKKYLDIRGSERIKFKDFSEEYLDNYAKLNNKSWEKATLCCIKCLNVYFGEKYLSEITPFLIEGFKAQRMKVVKPATVNRALACLKSMFNRAITWKKFRGDNPVKAVKFFKEESGRLRFLEKYEIAQLLENCNSYLKPIVILALNTGMRRGEIYNLQWQDVDFAHGLIHLLKTKNNEKREIPMNALVRETLLNIDKDPRIPYVFYNDEGKPFYNLRKSFFTACKKSAIFNFRFHDLRHTFASQLVMAGVDLNTVRELLGHKSLEMTLRYSHLSQGHKERAVELLCKSIVPVASPEGKELKVEITAQSFKSLIK